LKNSAPKPVKTNASKRLSPDANGSSIVMFPIITEAFSGDEVDVSVSVILE
jgi:hypothetical protein